MPPKKEQHHQQTNRVTRASTQDSGSEHSSQAQRSSRAKASLFGSLDPELLIDGWKDPTKAAQRKESSKKAADTKHRKRLAKQLLPGGFPHDSPSRDESPSVTEATTENPLSPTPIHIVPQPIPALAFSTVDRRFEGQHALVQPAQIQRDAHEPAARDQLRLAAIRRHSITVGNEVPAELTQDAEDEEDGESASRTLEDPFAAKSTLQRTPSKPSSHTARGNSGGIQEGAVTLYGGSVRGEEKGNNTPEKDIHPARSHSTASRHSTAASRHSRSSSSQRRDDDVRHLTSAVMELQENNRKLREELEIVKSRRSSVASVSRTPTVRGNVDGAISTREERSEMDRQENPAGATETPLSKRWVEMDEVQYD